MAKFPLWNGLGDLDGRGEDYMKWRGGTFFEGCARSRTVFPLRRSGPLDHIIHFESQAFMDALSGMEVFMMDEDWLGMRGPFS
jgi:hypothetical protein